jgi:hypothetical protein
MRANCRVVLASMFVAACAGREGKRTTDERTAAKRRDGEGTEAGAPVAQHKQLLQDMTGDGRPERFVVSANGPRYDSLTVKLEIRSPDDSLLYSASWPSASYFKYEDRATFDDSVAELTVRAHVDRLLADSAFGIGPRIGRGIDGRPADDLDAIRFDLAEERWRRAHHLPLGAPFPPGWWDGVHSVAGEIPIARIRLLANELRTRPSFRYYAGGEETYVIAWSSVEKRFVRIFACC